MEYYPIEINRNEQDYLTSYIYKKKTINYLQDYE